MTGLLFIPIRGGFTVSTMNVGKVYFSAEPRLNHAAINCIQSDGISCQAEGLQQAVPFYGSCGADRLFKDMLEPAGTGVKWRDRFCAATCRFTAYFNSMLSVPMYSL